MRSRKPDADTARDPSDGGDPAAAVYRWTDVFRYVVADKCETYLAIMDVFIAAKRRYQVHLREDEVRAGLVGGATAVALVPVVESELEQLVEWGTLRRTQDNREVRTLEEFRRRRSLYQLTAAGAAAHEAVREVERTLDDSGGSLSSALLPNVLEKLESLRAELAALQPDGEKLFRTLTDLHGTSSELAENARRFMQDLSISLEDLSATSESWAAYKGAVLVYLDRFIGRLDQHKAPVRALLAELSGQVEDRMLRLAAAADETPVPASGGATPRDRLAERWNGLRRWFEGTSDGPAEADLLGSAATDAISRILRVLQALHQRRFQRVDRTTDLVQLARWFQAADGDRGACELYDVSFGLSSARHFSQPSEDEEVESRLSFWDASPIGIEPRVVAAGRAGSVGRPALIVDYGPAKRRALDELRRRERRVRRAARAFGSEPVRLSELGSLTESQFELLLALLGDALRTAKPHDDEFLGELPDGNVRAVFRRAGARPLAIVRSETGVFRAPDLEFLVSMPSSGTELQEVGL